MEISELQSQPHDMNPGSAAPYLEGFVAQRASVGHTVDDQLLPGLRHSLWWLVGTQRLGSCGY
jgi:hypothetical protein